MKILESILIKKSSTHSIFGYCSKIALRISFFTLRLGTEIFLLLANFNKSCIFKQIKAFSKFFGCLATICTTGFLILPFEHSYFFDISNKFSLFNKYSAFKVVAVFSLESSVIRSSGSTSKEQDISILPVSEGSA